MTISARLNIGLLTASAALMAVSGAGMAQGWRGDPGLSEDQGASLNVLAQAEIPGWNAARLDHFFDAQTMRPAPNLESNGSPFGHAELGRSRVRRTKADIGGAAGMMPTITRKPLLIPEPRLTPTYELTFETLLKHTDDTDRYDDLIVRYSVANGLDPRLVKSIIAAESEFDFGARSPVGARGLMQVMPRTAAHLGVSPNALTTPEGSIAAGTAYLAELFRTVAQFYGLSMNSFINPPLWLTERVIACYHAGPSHLKHNHWVRQTKLYIRRVLLFYRSAVTQFHWAPDPKFKPTTWQNSL